MSLSHFDIELNLLDIENTQKGSGREISNETSNAIKEQDSNMGIQEVLVKKESPQILSVENKAKANDSKRRFFGTKRTKVQADTDQKPKIQESKQGIIKKFFKKFRGTKSPLQYQLQSSTHLDSFCSTSISWRNRGLRYFQTIGCLYLTACIFLAPYQYFFKDNVAIFHACNISDILYILLMLFRSRTTYSSDGIEEHSLIIVREGYQKSLAFALDLITFLPLLEQRIPIVLLDNSLSLLNRQTIVIRLHYILHYLGMFI